LDNHTDAKAFLLIPWGKFEGVKKDEGNFAPDAPYNLAVAASAPIWSSHMAMIFLPVAIICLALGLIVRNEGFIYIGRFFLAPGIVGLLDRLLAEHPRLYGMTLYVEQPFPYDLENNQIDVHSVSARKPLFMDESAHDWRMIRLGRTLGWTGVALKTCKTQQEFPDPTS
jgi:hypothetical protein